MFVLNRRADLHAIDATHWLISTQIVTHDLQRPVAIHLLPYIENRGDGVRRDDVDVRLQCAAVRIPSYPIGRSVH